jgi:hypothetical protein
MSTGNLSSLPLEVRQLLWPSGRAGRMEKETGPSKPWNLGFSSATKEYDKDSPMHCIYCNDTEENWDHLLQCQHETCASWCTDLLQTIQTRGGTLHTDPALLAILIESLHSWFYFDPSLAPGAAYPATYR